MPIAIVRVSSMVMPMVVATGLTDALGSELFGGAAPQSSGSLVPQENHNRLLVAPATHA
eukprot:s2851_g1.t1